MKRFYPELCEKYGKKYGLNPMMLEAVIWKESSGNRWATRFESHWRWFLHPIKYARMVMTTEKTERIHQMTSWGLMQVMGAVSRECLYSGPLPQLCEPQLGIQYGAKKLAECMRRFGNSVDALSAYNSGRPAHKSKAGRRYAESVIKYWDEIISQ